MNNDHVTATRPADASPNLLRAARAMLDWRLVDISSKAQISVSTMLCLERGRRDRHLGDAMARVLVVYEAVGITLLSLADGTEVLTRSPGQRPEAR